MKKRLIALLLCLPMLFVGCGEDDPTDPIDSESGAPTGTDGGADALGDDNKSFGEDLKNSGAYDGYFEGDAVDIEVKCLSGTNKAYKLEGNTLTFTEIATESVYTISGKLKGSIVIDVGDRHKFDLELSGLSLVSDTASPITVKSGDEVAIQAKKDTKNYIYDTRATVDPNNTSLHAGAIFSEVDLEIGGKGELTLISDNNNGVHSKKDLEVKNLTLLVSCADNALKGNDSVELENCNTTLIASVGDCIKTSNSDISDKGNQRGDITLTGGSHTLYAACDGMDAAHNAVVSGEATVLNIYTDKYSNYSTEVVSTKESERYLRTTTKEYVFSVKYMNSESGALEWVNAEYQSSIPAGKTTYHYYTFPHKAGYDKLRVFAYSTGSALQQETEYAHASEVLTVSTSYDTIAVSGSRYSWTNYTTQAKPGGFGPRPGGFGGMSEGNQDKGDHSTKGIKAANEIVIHTGTVNIKSYDDALHASKDDVLENGISPLGNVTVNGGVLTLYSNDDGIHADGALAVKAGTLTVSNSYEGLEGTSVSLSGGAVSIYAKDDGINATATSGNGVTVGGGTLYIYCSGDGIDTNSRTDYEGIVISGGKSVVISTSGMNSALDTEKGYTYTAGALVAIMPQGGMSSESTHCQSFASVDSSAKLSLTSGSFLVMSIGNETVTLKLPVSLSASVVVLGSTAPTAKQESETTATLDNNGVAWH